MHRIKLAHRGHRPNSTHANPTAAPAVLNVTRLWPFRWRWRREYHCTTARIHIAVHRALVGKARHITGRPPLHQDLRCCIGREARQVQQCVHALRLLSLLLQVHVRLIRHISGRKGKFLNKYFPDFFNHSLTRDRPYYHRRYCPTARRSSSPESLQSRSPTPLRPPLAPHRQTRCPPSTYDLHWAMR